MANKDIPNGLEPFGVPLRKNEYIAASAIYPGDPVRLTDAGKVARATSSQILLGAALSYAAADGDKVQVADHPDQYFKIQVDDDGAAAQTDINLNYNIVATSAAFNVAYKQSRVEADGSTKASGSASAALPLKALALSPEANNAFGTNAKIIVRINNHALSNQSQGV